MDWGAAAAIVIFVTGGIFTLAFKQPKAFERLYDRAHRLFVYGFCAAVGFAAGSIYTQHFGGSWNDFGVNLILLVASTVLIVMQIARWLSDAER